jgi:hypothetical protein
MYKEHAGTQVGLVFPGVVITSNAGTRTVTVIAEGYNNTKSASLGMMQTATVASSVMASFLGFKDSSLPQPGSRVLCVTDTAKHCFVIGLLPQPNFSKGDLPNRALLGAGDACLDEANCIGHKSGNPLAQDNRRATDVVDGEHVVGNEFGVLLGLYQQLAVLKGSELAQVQCFLLDDLVRIVSHNFQHYTALGEYNIYHDGAKIMAEFGATHKSGETYGKPATTSEAGNTFQTTGSNTTDDSSDFYAIDGDERIKAIERFKVFLGAVGDFVHFFVVRPHPDAIRTLGGANSSSKPDTGLSDVHLGTDGGVHIRSVKEIFIEKTNWIRVPHRIAAPDDPAGDDGSALKYDNKEPFEFSSVSEIAGLYPSLGHALQLRDYIAYTNEKLGYQNFKKHEKDFFVNDKFSQEQNIFDGGGAGIDSETRLHLGMYKLKTAGIYLTPNGGITIRDAWNSAIVMEEGNIYLQPANDLVSQPLRHNIMKVGGKTTIVSKEDVDISSSEGSIRSKAEKMQYIYSNKAGVIIQASGLENTRPQPDPTNADGKFIQNVGGIVLKSNLGIYNYALKDVLIYTEGKMLLQSLDNIDIVSDNVMTLYAKQSMYRFADSSMFDYAGNELLVLSDGAVAIAGADATTIGQKDQYLGLMYDEDSPFVDVLKGVLPVSDITASLQKAKEFKEDLLKQTIFQSADKFDTVMFTFPPATFYGGAQVVPMTMAQQVEQNTEKLTPWVETDINGSLPYPGKEIPNTERARKFADKYLTAAVPQNIDKDGVNIAASTNKPSTPLTLKSMNAYMVKQPNS